MNAQRLATKLRELRALVDDLERELAADGEALPPVREPRPRVKSTAIGHERAARALRKAGVYPRASR